MKKSLEALKLIREDVKLLASESYDNQKITEFSENLEFVEYYLKNTELTLNLKSFLTKNPIRLQDIVNRLDSIKGELSKVNSFVSGVKS